MWIFIRFRYCLMMFNGTAAFHGTLFVPWNSSVQWFSGVQWNSLLSSSEIASESLSQFCMDLLACSDSPWLPMTGQTAQRLFICIIFIPWPPLICHHMYLILTTKNLPDRTIGRVFPDTNNEIQGRYFVIERRSFIGTKSSFVGTKSVAWKSDARSKSALNGTANCSVEHALYCLSLVL